MSTKTPARKAPVSLLMDGALKELLQVRAERNLRTLSQEIIYLIETGLAEKSDQVRDTIHMIYKAQGYPFPSDLQIKD